MKILYKPFALLAGAIGAKLGQRLFKTVWARLDQAEPPTPTTREASLAKVVGARALEAATVAGVAAVVDRASARSFHYLIGVWPGAKRREQAHQ